MNKDKIIEYLDNNREKWVLGLMYLADDRFDNQYKTCEAHLDIILNDIKGNLSKL